MSGELVAALLGAMIGGGISLTATWMQIRAERQRLRDNERRDAYLAFLDWFYRFDPSVDSLEDDRPITMWDAGVIEARAQVFGSREVREALQALGFYRTSTWWGDVSEHRMMTAHLLHLTVALMRAELASTDVHVARASLASDVHYLFSTYRERRPDLPPNVH